MRNIKAIRFTFLLLYFLFNSTILTANDSEEKYHKAGNLIDENRFREAVSLYVEILKDDFELDNYKKSRIYNNIGYCYYKLKDYENALTYYKKAIKIDNNYLFCLNNISAVLLKKKKFAETLIYLNKAYEINKNSIKIIFNLFIVHARLRNKNLAKYFLNKAFEIDKDYSVKRLKKNGLSTDEIKKIQEALKNWALSQSEGKALNPYSPY